MNLKVVRDLEETERARRIAERVDAETAGVSAHKAILKEIAFTVEQERLERINSDEKFESLLLKTIESELDEFFAEVERSENRAEALELMEIERLRRVTILEANSASEEYMRRQSRVQSRIMFDVEKQRVLGQASFTSAAESASRKASLKAVRELEEAERYQRVFEHIAKESAELAMSKNLLKSLRAQAEKERYEVEEKESLLFKTVEKEFADKIQALEQAQRLRDARNASEQERFRRIAAQVGEAAAESVQRKEVSKLVNALQEAERFRRISLIAIEDAASKAEARLLKEYVIRQEEEERSRRIAEHASRSY